ncbi:MAG: hypothetical protein EU539_01110 [Promethearchaeota archaeon]|nr:MAG: hypothetical protein EU539_01110 [Candidatus Lokiarchaeota archaeon]
MSMYRSYLLKNGFFAKKGNESGKVANKVFIKHDLNVGGIYAEILENGVKRGVKIMVDNEEHWFNNFDKLDIFLSQLAQKQDDFVKIIKRKNISNQLRLLEI